MQLNKNIQEFGDFPGDKSLWVKATEQHCETCWLFNSFFSAVTSLLQVGFNFLTLVPVGCYSVELWQMDQEMPFKFYLFIEDQCSHTEICCWLCTV